jgi:hypothetical protein
MIRRLSLDIEVSGEAAQASVAAALRLLAAVAESKPAIMRAIDSLRENPPQPEPDR